MRKLARVRIEGALHSVTDARRDVQLSRTLAHVWKGQRGADNLCMNAVCILDSSEAFPHPVLAVSVTKTRAYVVDKPGHAVRYLLDAAAAEEVDLHDAQGIAEVAPLDLYKPRGKDRKGQSHSPSSPEGKRNGGRTPRKLERLGAARRELVAVGALAEE